MVIIGKFVASVKQWMRPCQRSVRAGEPNVSIAITESFIKSIGKYMKPGEGILQHLKKEKGSVDLPLDVLRQFQEFEKSFMATLESYEGDGSDSLVSWAMQSFHKCEVLALAYAAQSDGASLKRCFDFITEKFSKDPAFEDGVTLNSWVFFDFTTQESGKPVASELMKAIPDLTDFISPMLESRLGLYEVLNNDQVLVRLKEVFTNKIIDLDQDLPEVRVGNMIIARAVSFHGNNIVFGDYAEFPAEVKEGLLDTVAGKIFSYYPEIDDMASAYQDLMKHAGPYWFSIISQVEGEIYNPDFYKSFYK